MFPLAPLVPPRTYAYLGACIRTHGFGVLQVTTSGYVFSLPVISDVAVCMG